MLGSPHILGLTDTCLSLLFKKKATSGCGEKEVTSFSNSFFFFFLPSEFMVDILISYVKVDATQLRINFARTLRGTVQMGVIGFKPIQEASWRRSLTGAP